MSSRPSIIAPCVTLSDVKPNPTNLKLEKIPFGALSLIKAIKNLCAVKYLCVKIHNFLNKGYKKNIFLKKL